MPISDFQSQFSMSKSSESFSIFFFIEEYRAHFLLLAFFDKINFLTTQGRRKVWKFGGASSNGWR